MLHVLNDDPDTLAREESADNASAEGNTRETQLGSITIAIGTSLHDAERALILATLDRCGGVRKRTASLLGISLKTLYNRLMAYRTESPDPSGH